MPFALALLLAAVHPAWWPLIPMTFAIRGMAAWTVSAQVLHARINWFLLPIEDIAAFLFWIAGFFGNTILWRGRRYRLQSDGTFTLISSYRQRPDQSNP
jgi:ceramide glucosyltransferase